MPEEAREQEVIRDNSGRFRKGFSGNAGGRPRLLLTIKDTLGQYVPKAAERLAWLVENGETHTKCNLPRSRSFLIELLAFHESSRLLTMMIPSLETTPALSWLQSLTEPEAETLVDILAHPLLSVFLLGLPLEVES